MQKSSEFWIQSLELRPHPEGGYYTETYQSPDWISVAGLPARYTAERVCAKAIYFLLPEGQVSTFHRLKCEEIWCYHLGAPLTVSLIEENGTLRHVILGPHVDEGEQLQVLIPHGVWFGARITTQDAYSLISCITAPGFDFEDFELADRRALLTTYPQHQEIIRRLTYSEKERETHRAS